MCRLAVQGGTAWLRPIRDATEKVRYDAADNVVTIVYKILKVYLGRE